MSENSTLSYIHQDQLTGTAMVTDSNGSQVSSISYTPYCLTRSGDVPTDKKFTGQRLDGMGLYYYGARYYDPTIGRFISADPTIPDSNNPQGLNHYSYVINNPLKLIDPNGLDWLLVGGSNSAEKDMERWKAELYAQGLVGEGEEVYYIFDNDREFPMSGINACNIGPRYAQLDQWFLEHQGIANLKIAGHSEGAATVGTYISDWVNGTGMISNQDLLNSQLKGVFLVDCPTGPLSNLGLVNYSYVNLYGVGEKLSRKGIVSADIYNSSSLVHQSHLQGWQSYDLASWWQKALRYGASAMGPGVQAIQKFSATMKFHDKAKKDSLTVMKSILNK